MTTWALVFGQSYAAEPLTCLGLCPLGKNEDCEHGTPRVQSNPEPVTVAGSCDVNVCEREGRGVGRENILGTEGSHDTFLSFSS